MNLEVGIKLQAYLDGELTGREAQQVEALVKSDAQAGAMLAELQQTRTMLKGNEPEFRLPETREFYWSKIEREIERLEQNADATRSPAWLLFLRRRLGAISGVAVMAALVVFAAFQANLLSPGLLEEIDNPLDEVGSFSFRSESQKMTLIWISNPQQAETDESSETPPAQDDVH